MAFVPTWGMDRSASPYVFVVIAGFGFILEIVSAEEVALHVDFGDGAEEGPALVWTPARA